MTDTGPVFRAMMEQPDPPKTLYHYTDRKGLLGILKNKTIWASDAIYLNDKKELLVAVEMVKSIIESRLSKATEERKDLYTQIIDTLNSLPQTAYDAFVFSMCESKDELSLWRAYTKGRNAYSIGFDSSALRELGNEAGFRLLKCEYNEEHQSTVLTQLVEAAEKQYEEVASHGADRNRAHLVASLSFFAQFVEFAPIMKDSHFCEEQEWRLIYIGSAWGPKVEFRDTGSVMVPYVELNLEKGRGKKLPIKQVVVGPTPHLDLEKRAMSAVLTVNGLEDARVTETTIPYRDW